MSSPIARTDRRDERRWGKKKIAYAILLVDRSTTAIRRFISVNHDVTL
jgi:hypothetical protein